LTRESWLLWESRRFDALSKGRWMDLEIEHSGRIRRLFSKGSTLGAD
jgi:hypothetical protein